jgi:hypothetical protein
VENASTKSRKSIWTRLVMWAEYKHQDQLALKECIKGSNQKEREALRTGNCKRMKAVRGEGEKTTIWARPWTYKSLNEAPLPCRTTRFFLGWPLQYRTRRGTYQHKVNCEARAQGLPETDSRHSSVDFLNWRRAEVKGTGANGDGDHSGGISLHGVPRGM